MSIEAYIKLTYYVFTALIGLCVGSFLNVVIYRVPIGLSIAFPASHCPVCKNKIKWYDNIPVLSYIILGGKCRNCKTHISFRYTAVEILNMLLWVACLWRFYESGIVYSLLLMLTCSVLLCVFFIDLENMIIPDRFQIILCALAVAVILLENLVLKSGNFISNIIGGALGFAVFYLIAFLGEKIAGREALGGGDIKLAGVMGLFLGWQRLVLAMLIASITACIIIFATKRKKEQREFPFAPFLSAAFIISALFGNTVINWYISLLLNI